MSLIGKLAQLVVQLGVVVGQAFIQAYQQAAASACQAGSLPVRPRRARAPYRTALGCATRLPPNCVYNAHINYDHVVVSALVCFSADDCGTSSPSMFALPDAQTSVFPSLTPVSPYTPSDPRAMEQAAARAATATATGMNVLEARQVWTVWGSGGLSCASPQPPRRLPCERAHAHPTPSPTHRHSHKRTNRQQVPSWTSLMKPLISCCPLLHVTLPSPAVDATPRF